MAFKGWLFFSPTEGRVVKLLLDHDALTREQIATLLDESAEGRLKAVLASLTARRVLINGGDGYRLQATAEQRDELREWFAEQEQDAAGGNHAGAANHAD